MHAKAGKCADCEVQLKEVRSLALVTYRCPECGATQYKAGNCTDKECEHTGKPLVKSCELSGEPPHVAAKPAKSP